MVPILDDKKKLVTEFYNLVEDKLEKRIKKIIRLGGIKFKKSKVSPRLSFFLNKLIDDDNALLKKIITGNPVTLIAIVRWIKINYPQFLDSKDPDSIILNNIFVKHGYDAIDKFKFVKDLKLETCPYCNRNYILVIKKNREVKNEIDHFYPKTLYPLLAVSFYNLIPSCEPCNGFSAKGQLDSYALKLINPYLLKSDDFKFGFKINNISIINPLVGKSDVEIYFDKSIKSHLEIFNLEDLYSLHHDHAIELIIKQRIKYSDKYIKYLRSYKRFTFNKSEVDRMILGNYSLEKEQHKRPLSKMYQDIGKKLGLI
jgi:hypothetical protein